MGDDEKEVLICMGGPKEYDGRDFIEELIDIFTDATIPEIEKRKGPRE